MQLGREETRSFSLLLNKPLQMQQQNTFQIPKIKYMHRRIHASMHAFNHTSLRPYETKTKQVEAEQQLFRSTKAR